jgi:hypothetical protein
VTDAVAIQLITTVGTIATVIVTGWFNRRTTRGQSEELHKKIGEKFELAVRDSGAHALKQYEELYQRDRPMRTPLSTEAQPRQ